MTGQRTPQNAHAVASSHDKCYILTAIAPAELELQLMLQPPEVLRARRLIWLQQGIHLR